MYADDYAHNADMFRETERHSTTDRRTVSRQTGRLDEVPVSRKVPGQVPADKQVRDAESVETDRQREGSRQRGRQADMQTGRQTDSRTGSVKGRQTNRHADRHKVGRQADKHSRRQNTK